VKRRRRLADLDCNSIVVDGWLDEGTEEPARPWR